MDVVRELVPARARKAIYATYIVVGVIVGAVAAATDGSLEWVPAAERVLAFLAVPLAMLAGLNVNEEG